MLCSQHLRSTPFTAKTLHGAILIFQSAQKTTVALLLKQCLFYWVQQFVLNFVFKKMIQSEQWFFFSFFSGIMKLADDKMHLFSKGTGAQMYLSYWELSKNIYIECDCCVVNSCHLYVFNLCVSIFVVPVELAVIFLFKNGFDIPTKQLWLAY